MGVTQATIASGGYLIEDVLLLNGTVDLDGTADALILDADGDTTISSPTDNQIDIEIAGADDFRFTANLLNVLTGSSISGPSSTIYQCAPIAAQQALSGAGAVNITTEYTAFTSTGAGDALTLVDGLVAGHRKVITHVVDGGSGVLTPTNLSGCTTITFTTVGETAELVFNGTDWVAQRLWNPTVPGTPPVLA